MSISIKTRPEASALLTDPMFRKGFAEFFQHDEPYRDLGWMPEEAEAYGRGRAFGKWCAEEDEGRISLSRGGFPHPTAVQLLIRAIRMGDVP